MTYEQAVEAIHGLEKFGWELTLDRFARLLDRLQHPERQLRVIHVAGTNGKGSVCNLTANALIAAGYKVGLYTSPYVIDFRERFQINGQMIPTSTFAALSETVLAEMDALRAEGVHITEFEAITAIAFLYFAREGCDFTVLEVGLGGRFDATNVVPPPAVCAITSISLDHVQILGDTIEKIAWEKAGILKPGSTACLYPKMNPAALPVFQSAAAAQGVTLRCPTMEEVSAIACTPTGSQFCYQGVPYRLKLVGEHQIANAVLALAVLDTLRAQKTAIPIEAVQAGFARTAFPGRFEILSDRPFVVDDGAHNEEGCTALAATLAAIPNRKVVLMGMLADKDVAHSAAQIARCADEFYCVPVQNPRALPPEELRRLVLPICPSAKAFATAKEAVEQAFSQLSPDDMVLGCGSLYLVGELRALFLERL